MCQYDAVFDIMTKKLRILCVSVFDQIKDLLQLLMNIKIVFLYLRRKALLIKKIVQ